MKERTGNAATGVPPRRTLKKYLNVKKRDEGGWRGAKTYVVIIITSVIPVTTSAAQNRTWVLVRCNELGV